MLNANMVSTINTLKMKVPNRVFHEWCNTLIQCQSDRSMKNTLTFTVQKFSDQRIIQSELEAIIIGSWNWRCVVRHRIYFRVRVRHRAVAVIITKAISTITA